MAWQRKIPFGYLIRDGLIQSHPQEADAVRYIFGQYLAGASLLTIAEDMTRRGIRYHQHTAEWNKNMVKAARLQTWVSMSTGTTLQTNNTVGTWVKMRALS